MKRVAILQSSYIPWKGYFAIISLVDEFIIYDDVQYCRRDWRNRNLIKTEKGATWLTIPIFSKGHFNQPVRDVKIADPSWALRHWKTIQLHYRKARFFRTIAPFLTELYERAAEEIYLSSVNELFIRAICDLLNIKTRITRSADYELRGDRNERLIFLCQQAGAQEYLTGPKAMSYIDKWLFADNKIMIRWMNYSAFPEYSQLFTPPFIHEVTILDLLMNEGIDGAKMYMSSTLAHCLVGFPSSCAS